MGDEIAFKLDTNQGLLEIYHSYYGCIDTCACSRRDALRLLWSREAGDVRKYIKIDNTTRPSRGLSLRKRIYHMQ